MLSLKITYQIIMIVMIWYLVEQLLHWLEVSLPASVLGLFLLLFLLKKHILQIQYIEQGGDFLLKNMLLFFIPPVVGLVQYADILLENGFKICTAIFIGTFIVMYSSKMTVRLLMRSSPK
ncbi:CidA/LrgA family protein [Acinetobacter baumannii]|nr:CidA/LrgA family protein [Acinetobacter baumannii]